MKFYLAIVFLFSSIWIISATSKDLPYIELQSEKFRNIESNISETSLNIEKNTSKLDSLCNLLTVSTNFPGIRHLSNSVVFFFNIEYDVVIYFPGFYFHIPKCLCIKTYPKPNFMYFSKSATFILEAM